MYLFLFCLSTLGYFAVSRGQLIPLSDGQKQEFVDAHNAARINAGAAAMKKIVR